MSDNKDLSSSTEYSEGTTGEGGRREGRGRGRGGRGGRGRGGRGRDSPRPPRPEVPGHRVSISHLPKDTTKEDISHLCQPYGKINDVFVRKYEAIVTFDSYTDATYAIFDLSQKKYRDDHIIVDWAKAKKQFNDKEKKENGETEEDKNDETKESGEKKSEGEDQKDQDGKTQKKDPKEAEKKEEKPARPLFSEMQKVSTGSNPGKKQPKKATQAKKKNANKQTDAQAPSQQSDKQQDIISVAAPEPALKPVASQPPAQNGTPTPAEQPASGKKAKQNKKQQQQDKGTQQQSDNSQGKPARFEVKMRDINTRDVKSTLMAVSSEDIERFLKPLVPIFEVTVRNEATGEEKVYGLTDYHLKNNFTPFVQAYYSQLGDK